MADKHFFDAAVFPIGELSQRTGVNSITLRAWERRYALLKPARTAKGHRLYTAEDVERVMRVLTLIERGVPLRKLHPLLDSDEPLPSPGQDQDALELQSQLLAELEQFSVDGLAGILQELFKQYPASWCRQQVLLPLFARLASHVSASALEGLLQAGLIRYALRYWSQGAGKKRQGLLVVGGVRTASWRTLLLALELQEKQQAVLWLPGEFSLTGLRQMLMLKPQQQLLYCLDGVLSAGQEQQLRGVLLANQQLWLQGTAVELAFAGHERVLGESLAGLSMIAATGPE